MKTTFKLKGLKPSVVSTLTDSATIHFDFLFHGSHYLESLALQVSDVRKSDFSNSVMGKRWACTFTDCWSTWLRGSTWKWPDFWRKFSGMRAWDVPAKVKIFPPRSFQLCFWEGSKLSVSFQKKKICTWSITSLVGSTKDIILGKGHDVYILQRITLADNVKLKHIWQMCGRFSGCSPFPTLKINIFG